MMNGFNKSDTLLLKHQNSRLAVKNWSDEDLVDLIKKVLKADINLDFLLELRTTELEILAACIRDRIGQVGK
jgi:hypothetical protein